MTLMRKSLWFVIFFFSSRRRHTRFDCDWSSDVCSSDLKTRAPKTAKQALPGPRLVKVALCLGILSVAVFGTWRERALVRQAWDSMHGQKNTPTVAREDHPVPPSVKEAIVEVKPTTEVKPPAEVKPQARS